ncbi:hypothetical protein D3C81_1046300 [compost metagenome]
MGLDDSGAALGQGASGAGAVGQLGVAPSQEDEAGFMEGGDGHRPRIAALGRAQLGRLHGFHQARRD